MFSYVMLVFSVGFLIPFLQLVEWLFMTYDLIISEQFLWLIWNSVFVAFIAAAFITIIAVIIANFSRMHEGIVPKLLSKTTLIGYSIPGAVIALGVLTLFLELDKVQKYFYGLMNQQPSVILSLSIAMLIFAYIIRFLAIGYNSVEAGFDKVGRSFTEASRMLGMNMTQSFFKVDFKMVKGAVFGGFILVFVEVLKELPLTLILQPFNFYTLATKAFQYAGDEMVHEAALASILIILISGVSIYVFHSILEKETN